MRAGIHALDVASLPVRQTASTLTGEFYGQVRSLGDACGLRRLIVQHETIHPGLRASAPHAHSHKEELVYVLEGVATVHRGMASLDVPAGGFIGFPPGLEAPHHVENRGAVPLILLTIGVVDPLDRTSFKAPVEPASA